MEFTKATRQYKILEDGSHRVESYAQWENYFLKYVVVFVPKTTKGPISPKLVQQFVSLGQQNITESGVSVSFMPNPTGPPYYNLTPSSKPQHRIMVDSGTFDHCGLFEPSPNSYCNKQEPDQFLLVQKEFSNIFSNLTKTYVTWSQNKDINMQLLVQCDLYDLRSTEFFKSRNGKTWMSERTMTRKMARELEHLIGGSDRHYKGVRWRPERKHPWVAEIKLPKKKKMWIGNFDTPEEAARAYDVAAICHGKKTRLNFGDFCKPVSKPTTHSLLPSKQHTGDLSFKALTQSDGSCENAPECLVPALRIRMMSEYPSTSEGCSISKRVMELNDSAESSDSKGYTIVSEIPSTLKFTGQPPLETCLLTGEDPCSSNQVIEINDSVNLESRATCLEKSPTLESADQPPLPIQTYENVDLGGIKSYSMFSNDLPSTENYSFFTQGTDISLQSRSHGLYPNGVLSDLHLEGEFGSGVDLTIKEIGLCLPLEDYELDPKTSDLKVFEDLQEENFSLQLWEE